MKGVCDNVCMEVDKWQRGGECEMCVCNRQRCDLATGEGPIQRCAVGVMFASPGVPPWDEKKRWGVGGIK